MMEVDGKKLKRDYIDFPINVKYKIQIPVISKIFAPFVSTGPDFALLLSDSDTGDFKTRKWNTSWNVGFGAELFRKLQIHANYGIGLTKAFEYIMCHKMIMNISFAKLLFYLQLTKKEGRFLLILKVAQRFTLF